MDAERITRFIILWLFIVVFASCAVILLAGQALATFYGQPLPQSFTYAFGIVILEPIAFLTLWVKDAFGLKSTTKVIKCSSEKEINCYMKDLISSGSTLDIVSVRLHWVSDDATIKNKLIARSKNATINIFLPAKNQISEELSAKGINIHIIPELLNNEHARFTLVDKYRPGSTVLAVGCGNPKDFVISEFHIKNNAQVVALARDYIGQLMKTDKQVDNN